MWDKYVHMSLKIMLCSAPRVKNSMAKGFSANAILSSLLVKLSANIMVQSDGSFMYLCGDSALYPFSNYETILILKKVGSFIGSKFIF
jgi:hypothetical protein